MAKRKQEDEERTSKKRNKRYVASTVSRWINIRSSAVVSYQKSHILDRTRTSHARPAGAATRRAEHSLTLRADIVTHTCRKKTQQRQRELKESAAVVKAAQKMNAIEEEK